ncbi:TOXD protein [Colletotrichum orchidophilum]|uniref:TOXD protein n=1 Tax=Colletotrichum orchidophilum TaxID=1209926 RepID=A0A1G4AZR8_9PEZI|nr:TOXD protein [Colletotrichum orchidophilum]OHE94670.1 TOXD protein [Colletotrichum orchidophilum]
MSSNHAIVIQGAGKAQVVEASVPKLRDDYLIVKVVAVALNPTDVAHIDLFAVTGARVGCDYAGIVEEVGSKVTKAFKKGDRVAGVAHGSNAVYHEDGTFAEFITVKGDLQIRIPDNVSFEEAATLGVSVTTVGQSLYQSLGLPYFDKPSTEKLPVLIYGGSTATGALAIQYAKLSGLHVITTASPHNFEYLKKLGADVILDYRSETVVEDIKKSAGGQLKHALDCISSESSANISVKAIAEDGGNYSSLRAVSAELVSAINSHVTPKVTLAYTALGEPFQFGPKALPAIPADLEFGSKFWSDTERLLEEGKVVAHKATVNEGGSGLEGVLKGLDLVRQGKVSGTKLVYTLSQ